MKSRPVAIQGEAITPAELARREKLLDDLDTAAYDCAGCLLAMDALGKIDNLKAVQAARSFRCALADVAAVMVVDKAAKR